ncbi:MAG TPA: APC family permease [Streptosporangiaceae bacterium]|jgi:amino acid transporter|nr:APC family permease [Streptosporangiaceae bacterium]
MTPSEPPGTATPAAATTAADDYDVSEREEIAKLRRGAVGLGGVLFLTVTGSAPISAMLFNTPIAVGFGQGLGTPAAFGVATIVLVVFSVGYVAMARKKTTAGGFYSYISHGLGRELGIGTGFGMVVAYSVFEASLCGGFAYFLGLKLNAFGVNVSWPWLALGMVVLISLLTYFDVRISSTVLAIGLISEILILTIFDVFMFAHGHVNWGAINPLNAFRSFPASGKLAAGAVGIGMFFAFWSWVGFEMAPNYGEESRDPKRIVPRALYISVIGLGIFYTITSWAPLNGYSTIHAAIAQAQGNPANFYLAPAKTLAAPWVSSVMSYLIITGSFACGMAFHNTTARYFYSLGREGLLPSALGRTHPKWKSPNIASITQSVIAAFIIALFAIFTGTNDPTSQAYVQVYGLMAVMGVIIILSVQALVSLAILVYYERYHRDEVHWWKTRLAPTLAFLSQGYVVYLLFTNIGFLGASSYSYAYWLGPIDFVVVLGGIGAAFYLKRYKPHKFEMAGRLINEGL